MKDSGELAKSKDDADYLLLIISQEVNSNKMFRVQEYYPNKKPKLTATSLDSDYLRLKFNGPLEKFYPNGNRESILNYNNGQLSGIETGYFLNGKLNYTVIHMPDNSMKYIECRDSTGNVLTTNGNGKWVDVDEKNIITRQGKVVDSLQDGEWHGNAVDGVRYTMTYKMGIPGPGIGYDHSGKAYPFKIMEIQATFKGEGKDTYSDFLIKNIVVPAVDRQKGVGGKVILNFVIETNGTPDNFKVLRTPDQSLADESVRVMLLSRWNPGMQYGIPVRSYFTLPINFTLAKSK